MNPKTRRYAVIGDPVSHSLSPAMQNAAFDALGIDASYEAMRLTPSELPAFAVRARTELAGFNVTTPLKEVMLEHLDEADSVVRNARAVNTVAITDGRLVGRNTDGNGFMRAVREAWSFDPRGAGILMLGAGPAARAIALALAAAGATDVWQWSRRLGLRTAGPERRSMDLVICATPPLAYIPKPILALIGARTKIFDLNYGTPHTPIPPWLGGERSNGLPLLLYQGALAFEWWTGRPAPLAVMGAALGS